MQFCLSLSCQKIIFPFTAQHIWIPQLPRHQLLNWNWFTSQLPEPPLCIRNPLRRDILNLRVIRRCDNNAVAVQRLLFEKGNKKNWIGGELISDTGLKFHESAVKVSSGTLSALEIADCCSIYQCGPSMKRDSRWRLALYRPVNWRCWEGMATADAVIAAHCTNKQLNRYNMETGKWPGGKKKRLKGRSWFCEHLDLFCVFFFFYVGTSPIFHRPLV